MSKYESRTLQEGREIICKIEEKIRTLKSGKEDARNFELRIGYIVLRKILNYIKLLEYYRTGYGN